MHTGLGNTPILVEQLLALVSRSTMISGFLYQPLDLANSYWDPSNTILSQLPNLNNQHYPG
jgi:hypothetical protein